MIQVGQVYYVQGHYYRVVKFCKLRLRYKVHWLQFKKPDNSFYYTEQEIKNDRLLSSLEMELL